MTDYDYWLLQGPGGPYDDGDGLGDEADRASAHFHAMPPRARWKARRGQKRSTIRRLHNRDWRRRQRREDQNAQAVF